jgi:hypothetical protein
MDQGYRKVQNEKASENEPVGSSAMLLPPSKYKPAKTRLIKSKKGSQRQRNSNLGALKKKTV